MPLHAIALSTPCRAEKVYEIFFNEKTV